MNDQNTSINDDGLELFFAAGQKVAPEPSEALLARIERAALAEQPGVVSVPETAVSKLRRVFENLGGWPVFAGLATATVAGVWIGYSDPSLAVVPAFSTSVTSDDVGGLLPGYGTQDDWSS